MNSWCSRCALLTRPTVGSAISASRAISPGWFMPISTTAARWPACRRNRVSGTPISLFRLPRVERMWSAPYSAARMDAIISLTVVLPLLPVTPMTGIAKRLRHTCAIWPSAWRVSGTTSAGSERPAGTRSTTAAAAPRTATSARKSCASKRSPRSATNRLPGSTVWLLVDTPLNPASAVSEAPGMAFSSSLRAACISGLRSGWHAWPAPARHGRRRGRRGGGP